MKDLTIIVGTVGQSIMRSTDNGKSWERVGPRRGFPSRVERDCRGTLGSRLA